MKTCTRCHHSYDRTEESDPCFGNLPGVLFACCGHGTEPGYMLFANGVRLKFTLLASEVKELPPEHFISLCGGARPPCLPKASWSRKKSKSCTHV